MSTNDRLRFAGVLQQNFPILPDNVNLLKKRTEFWKVMLHKRQRNHNITVKNVLIDSAIIMGKEPLLSIYNILQNRKNSNETSIIDFTSSNISTFYFDTSHIDKLLEIIKPKNNYISIENITGKDIFIKSSNISYNLLYRTNKNNPIQTITILENQELFDLYHNFIFLYLYNNYIIDINNFTFIDDKEYKIIINGSKLTVTTNSYANKEIVYNIVTNPDGTTSTESSYITVIRDSNKEEVSLKVLDLIRYDEWQLDIIRYEQEKIEWLEKLEQWLEDKKEWESNPDNNDKPYPIPIPTIPNPINIPTEDEYKYYFIPFPYTDLANLNDSFWINNIIFTITYYDINNNLITEDIPFMWFDSFALVNKENTNIDEDYKNLNIQYIELLNWFIDYNSVLKYLRYIGYTYQSKKQLNIINSINLGLPLIGVWNHGNSSNAYSNTITFPTLLEFKTEQSITDYYVRLAIETNWWGYVTVELPKYLNSNKLQTNLFTSTYSVNTLGKAKDDNGNILEPSYTNHLKAYKDMQIIKQVMKKVGTDYYTFLFEEARNTLDDERIILHHSESFKTLKNELRKNTEGMPTTGIDLNFIIPIFNNMPKSVQIALYTFFEQLILETQGLKQLPNTINTFNIQDIEINYNTKTTNSVIKINNINLEIQESKININNKIFNINTSITNNTNNNLGIHIEYQKNANIKVILDITNFHQTDIMKIFVEGNSNVSNRYYDVKDTTETSKKLDTKNYCFFVPLTKEVINTMPFQFIPELACYSFVSSFSLISWNIEFGNTLAFEILSIIGTIFQTIATLVIGVFTIYTAPIAFIIGTAIGIGLKVGSMLLTSILKAAGVSNNLAYQIIEVVTTVTSIVVSAFSGNYLVTAIDTLELVNQITDLSTTIRMNEFEKELKEKQDNLNKQVELITNQLNTTWEYYNPSDKFNSNQVLDIINTEITNPIFNMPFKDVYKVSTMLGSIYEPFYYTYEPIKNFVSNSLKL